MKRKFVSQIINEHAHGLKQEIGTALSLNECESIIKEAVIEALIVFRYRY